MLSSNDDKVPLWHWTLTVFWFLEKRSHKHFFGLLHQLYDTLVDWIFVLVQPSIGIVSNLRTVQRQLHAISAAIFQGLTVKQTNSRSHYVSELVHNLMLTLQHSSSKKIFAFIITIIITIIKNPLD